MRVEDIGQKTDNPQKLLEIDNKNIPANEVVMAEEFNCLVEEIKELKNQLSREQHTEHFTVNAGHISGNYVVYTAAKKPIESSLLVFVRGLALAPSDLEVNDKIITINRTSVTYGIETGDLIVIHYQSK